MKQINKTIGELIFNYQDITTGKIINDKIIPDENGSLFIYNKNNWKLLPNYIEDMNYAWLVLEKIRKEQPIIGMITIKHEGYSTTVSISDADCNQNAKIDLTNKYSVPTIWCICALKYRGLSMNEIKSLI